MTATLSRAEQLRNDLENMQFSRKYLIGVLAELEQLGRTHTKEYANVKKNYDILGNNVRRVEAELERVEMELSEIIDEELIGMDTEDFLELWEEVIK